MGCQSLRPSRGAGSATARASRWLLPLSTLACAACTEIGSDEPRISEVTPLTVHSGVPTLVTIRGERFYSSARVSLDSSDPPTVERSVSVEVGVVPVSAADVALVDTDRIEVWVPTSLAPGPYAVTVHLGPNRSVTRDDALRVEPSSSDAGAGDGGAVIAAQSDAGGWPPDGGRLGDRDAGVGVASPCDEPGECEPCIDSSCLGYRTVRAIAAVAHSAEEDDPSFTADLLELYFNSNRSGVSGIWLSRRASASEPWGAPELVSALSTDVPETQPNVSRDGLEVHFARVEAASWRIMRSTRPSRADEWSSPVRVSELNQAGDDYTAHVSAGGLELLMHRREPGSNTDLFRARRVSPDGVWGAIVPLTELNTTGGEAGPVLHLSERQIFFDSSRTGSGDIYTALRPSADAAFGTPVAVDSLNTAAPEEGACVSDDLRYVVFTRQVAGNWELYEALR